LEHVRQEVISLKRQGYPAPTLAQISVGAGPTHERLQGLQANACRITGVSFQDYVFPQGCDYRGISQTLADLNADPSVAGIAMHVRPAGYLNELASAIAPDKDVDGLHPLHVGGVITNKRARRRPRGADIVQLLAHVGLRLVGRQVICLGNASGLAGILTWLCLHENATVSAWKRALLWPMDILPRADVLIIDTDDLPPIDGTALKPGVTVVDARRRPDGWLQHRSEALPEAVSLLIPVPDGVGPTTTAMRLASLLAIYRTLVIAPVDS
jgi:methylenetetrahydrofolate dehydrogenase (NADP+)/methenyltetrahydrofolate cyclohydrolase